MAIPFSTTPSAIRVPLFYAEVDGSQASGSSTDVNRTVMIGQKLAAGTATAEVLVFVPSASAARGLFGEGSDLHRMAVAFKAEHPNGELWAVPIADAAGVNASGTLTVTGPATASGTLHIYIGGQKVAVGVASGDVQNDIATAINAAINAADDLPVTSTVLTNAVTVTARHKGTTGNAIDMRLNYLGAEGGEALPAGVAVAVVQLTNGATDPTVDNAIAALGDERFSYIVPSLSDATTHGDLTTELVSRWAPTRRLYGHVFSAKQDTVGNLTTFGNARNDGHLTVLGMTESPTPDYEIAASYGGACALSLDIDPARPLQTVPLRHVKAPALADRFTWAEANTLLYDGIAVPLIGRDGVVRIGRAVTTYQTNALGAADAAFLDTETLATLEALLRGLESRITTKFPRHKIADDGTRFGAGAAIVTPSMIRGELIAWYAEQEAEGLVEDAEGFAAALIVERSSTDSSRVDVLLPPSLIQGLRVFATLAQFRLGAQ